VQPAPTVGNVATFAANGQVQDGGATLASKMTVVTPNPTSGVLAQFNATGQVVAGPGREEFIGYEFITVAAGPAPASLHAILVGRPTNAQLVVAGINLLPDVPAGIVSVAAVELFANVNHTGSRAVRLTEIITQTPRTWTRNFVAANFQGIWQLLLTSADTTDPLQPDDFVKVVKGTTAAQAVPYITRNVNPAASPVILQPMRGTSYNQGLRLNRAAGGGAHAWCGMVVGGQWETVQSVDPPGDGVWDYSVYDPAGTGGGGGGPVWWNSRSTWWVSSNQQGDFSISQSAPTRLGAGVNATTPPTTTTDPTTVDQGTTGFYCRRSDGQVWMMGRKLVASALDNTYTDTAVAAAAPPWLNYAAQLTPATGFTRHAATRFISNGRQVQATLVIATPATVTDATTLLTIVPTALRPASVWYVPFATYTTAPQQGGVSGDLAINPNGTITTDRGPGTGQSTAYIFSTFTYWTTGNEPPAA
jgi:hypothetical protein